MKQDYKVPHWLNKAYLAKVLKGDSNRNEDIFLINYHIESATNKGDNYASEMFRIVLDYSKNGTPHQRRVILKKDHADEGVQKMLDPYNLYSTEINYYRLLLPEFERILRSIGDSSQLSPRMIFHEDPVFVMEDVAPLNYRTVNREDRMDNTTAKLVLTKLAKFHAASMVYNNSNGRVLENQTGQFFEIQEGFLEVLLKKFDTLLMEMNLWGTEYQSLIPKMEYIRQNYSKIGSKSISPTDGLGVLVHGDAWLNNIMIKYDEQETPVDVLLIDLQISYWSSPAIDLIYFVYTSLNEEDYQMRFDELIKHYHDNWSRLLRALNYSPIPSLMELQLDIHVRHIHALFSGILVKSVIYAADSSSADVNTMLNNDGKKDQTFKQERFKEELKYLLKLLDCKGVLDVVV